MDRKILFTGRGTSGSWQIRGVQLAAAIGARAVPAATAPDCARADVVIGIKRLTDEMLRAIRPRPLVWDIVDAWPQPYGNDWNRVECMDWLASELDRIRPAAVIAATGGSTALIQSTLEAIDSLRSAFYDYSQDISNLLYVITDGQDNSSSPYSRGAIGQRIQTLGDRWSVAVLVPSVSDRQAAMNYGFPAGNIEVWNATSIQGVEIAARAVQQSYMSYSTARSAGFTNSSNLFHVDASNLTNSQVKANLKEFNGRIFPVRADSRIDEFVSKATGKPYIKGSAYYELTKYEKKVQGYKKIAIRSKTTDKTYGGDEARKLLGLGAGDVAVSSGIVNGNWRVFVQSTSDNRKLIAGTSVLVEG